MGSGLSVGAVGDVDREPSPLAPERAFDPELFRFLRELAQHNRRDWFRANQIRYREHVEEPARAFVRSAGPRLRRISSHLLDDPRPNGGSVMRIYRNVRFSRDKTPYRTSVGIRFMHDGGANTDQYLPGFYLNLGPGNCWALAGVWEPDRAGLERIRRAIVRRSPAWRKVRASIPSIEGDSLKRSPPGFPASHPFLDDLRRRSFGARIRFADAVVLRPGFPEHFVRLCERLDPLNRFLAKALEVDY